VKAKQLYRIAIRVIALADEAAETVMSGKAA
jgi:hypothetical protein